MTEDKEHIQCRRCGTFVLVYNRMSREKRDTYVCSWCHTKRARQEYDERRRQAKLDALTDADWEAIQDDHDAWKQSLDEDPTY